MSLSQGDLSGLRLVVGSLVLAFASGCGVGGGGGGGTAPPQAPSPIDDSCEDGGGPPISVTGTVLYERLVLDDDGLGPELEVRPARHVDVLVRLASGGACLGQGSTDANGRFDVVVRPEVGRPVEVWALSRTTQDSLRRLYVHDALPPRLNNHGTTDVFFHASPPLDPALEGELELIVPYRPGAASRPSIGFGLLDVLVTCWDAVHESTGQVPSTCHAYTRLGNNGSTGTSFYDDASKSITLLGGAAGNLDGSDTDYFDDAVIAHEFAHFLEFNLSHSLTRGGAHAGEALEPAFAFSEGQATGFGCLCRADPTYRDSVTTTGGGNQLDASVENWPQLVRGIGGEETVAELIWDLGDGAGDLLDGDGDGVILGLGPLYDAFFAFDSQRDVPYIGLLLDRLTDRGDVSELEISSLCRYPEDQQISYPLVGDDVWPIPLDLPGSASGVADATVANPCRAYLASRWYRFELSTRSRVTLDLEIEPLGISDNDLNLALLDTTGALYARSVEEGSSDERIGPIDLAAGVYIVRVEASCAGFGSRAEFRLYADVVP